MESVVRGKGIIIGTITMILFFDFIIIAWNTLSGEPILQGAIRFILECVILYFLCNGRAWAKWLIAILMILAAVLSMLTIFIGKWLIALLGIVYLVFGIALIASKDVRAYMDYKNGANHIR